jgi:hypothetical protein
MPCKAAVMDEADADIFAATRELQWTPCDARRISRPGSCSLVHQYKLMLRSC